MIVSILQDKQIEFDCQMLVDILRISNESPKVFEINIIPIIKGFIYDESVILHTCRNDFSPRAKIKNQDVLLQPGLLHRIIAYNILPKKDIMMRSHSWTCVCLIIWLKIGLLIYHIL
jgi:hypothetical protein